jgi:hypothetical protein
LRKTARKNEWFLAKAAVVVPIAAFISSFAPARLLKCRLARLNASPYFLSFKLKIFGSQNREDFFTTKAQSPQKLLPSDLSLCSLCLCGAVWLRP